MLTTKTCSRRFTIDDLDAVTQPGGLVDKLSADMVGRCYADCYATKIIEAEIAGPITITQNTYPPMLNVEITFTLIGLCLPPGYITVDCLVRQVTNNMIYFDNDILNGYCESAPENAYVSAGQRVAIIVKNAIYTGQKISIVGAVFSHRAATWPAYKIVPGAGEVSRDLRGLAEARMGALADSEASAKILASPLKQGVDILAAAFDTISIGDTISAHPRFELSCVRREGADMVINCSKVEAITRILTEFIMYADLVTFISKTYNTPSAISEYKGVLIAIKNSQRAVL